jgi:hypothetical protein
MTPLNTLSAIILVTLQFLPFHRRKLRTLTLKTAFCGVFLLEIGLN